MQRLLYVSESRIKQTDAQSEVEKIVNYSQIKNAELGITGALIFTGEHFAQVLEGTPEAIHMLMAYIYTDSRHENVVVMDQSPITRRRFSSWQMAYQGPSQFVSRHVARLLHATSPSETLRAVEWITDLASEFAKPGSVPHHAKVVGTRPSR